MKTRDTALKVVSAIERMVDVLGSIKDELLEEIRREKRDEWLLDESDIGYDADKGLQEGAQEPNAPSGIAEPTQRDRKACEAFYDTFHPDGTNATLGDYARFESRYRRHWDDDEISLLRTMVDAGFSADEMSHRLARPLTGVMKMLWKLGYGTTRDTHMPYPLPREER